MHKYSKKHIHCPVIKTHFLGSCIYADMLRYIDLGIIVLDIKEESMAFQNSAAMPSAILSLSKKATRDQMKGELEQVYLKRDDSYLLMLHSGEELFLTALVTNAAKLGMIFLEMRKAVRNILDIL